MYLNSLSAGHPASLGVHHDIKLMMPISDQLALLKAGFQDCSWGNDECPSFYIPNGDDEHTLGFDGVEFFLMYAVAQNEGTYRDVNLAIAAYYSERAYNE